MLEDGHANAGDALRLYKLFQEKFQHEQSGPLNGLRFVSKADCLALAAADLSAHVTYQVEIGNTILGVPKKPMKSEAS